MGPKAVPSLLEQSVAALAIARILADLEGLPQYGFASTEWQRIKNAAEKIVLDYMKGDR